MQQQPHIEINDNKQEILLHGEWTLNSIQIIKHEIARAIRSITQKVLINGKDIVKMDSAGSFILVEMLKELDHKKISYELTNFPEQSQALINLSLNLAKNESKIASPQKLNFIQKIGKFSTEEAYEFLQFLNFIGTLFFDSLTIILKPFTWRYKSVINVINVTGTSALPIIALLSFMIGIVISYQMGNQLRNYGANIFIVNLLGLSVLREFGPLITAIMVAGRTGSAFAAEIGIMKINQEIDALNTMGIKTNVLLIIPRLTALLIVMPLLTMWADIFGVFGGMLMAQNMLDINWFEFLNRFRTEIPLRALNIGLLKAPLFALIIASVGCFQGMKVTGSAESVGFRTTRSVVVAIFLIVVVDAYLSVLLSKYKL